MENFPISQAAYDAAIAELRAQRRLPSFDELSSFAGGQKGLSVHKMDFAVNLRDALRAAHNEANCTVLRVYADVVRLPGGFHIDLGKRLQRLDIVARRLEIEDTDGNRRAELRLSDNPERASAAAARLFVGEISGDLQLRPPSTGSASHAEGERILPSSDLRPWTYSLQKGDPPTVAKAQTKLPLEALANDGPVYQLLKASFELAAGLTAEARLDSSKLQLAHSLLKWLMRWSSYPSADLVPLFQAAASLERVLPIPVQSYKPSTVYVVPPYTAAAYQVMAKTQWDSAKDYDLQAKFEQVGNRIGQAVGLVVRIWEERDKVDIGELDERIVQARDRVGKALSAMKSAAREIEEQAFANRFSARQLKLVQEQEFIKAAVKAAFQAAFAVCEIAGGIASGVGTPGAIDAINPGPAFKMIAGANVPLGSKAKAVAGVILGYYGAVWDNFWNMDKDARDSLMNAGKLVTSGFMSLGEAAAKVLQRIGSIEIPSGQPATDLDYAEANDIGALVSSMSNAPAPPETKAAWDAFLAEAVSEFDKMTLDPDTPQSVREAALDYKAGVEKLAIYGRMLSERQAILAQEVRELGSLILSKASVRKKQGQLDSLMKDLGDEAKARKELEAQNAERLRELGRTYFATAWGFRSAIFYEGMKWEIPSLTIPTSGLQMGDVYKRMEQAMLGLPKADNRGALNTTVRIDQANVLEDLKNHGSAKITIDLNNRQFAGYDWVRVQSLAIWLDGVTPHGANGIDLSLTGESSMTDRSLGAEFSFVGQPVRISFKYLAGGKTEFGGQRLYIRPTPFSTWTLRIQNKLDLDLGELSAVRLEFACHAAKAGEDDRIAAGV